MQLLIDIGNTRIKWRWARQGELLPGGAELLPPDGHEWPLFSRLWGAAGAPERLLVSNVAGDQVRDALAAWSLGIWGCETEFVVSGARQGEVVNGYAETATLGADRWCSLIGARVTARGPLCVVGCGTALTVDLLAADGRHQGGLIAPGFRSMAHVLTTVTRGIHVDVVPAPVAAPLGRTTAECIRSGVLSAAVGMVEHALDRLAFPADGLVLITGGDAELLASELRRPFRVEPDLVFRGLAEIAGDVR